MPADISLESHSTYLIVGAGIAGMTAATSIRTVDKTSFITLINGEPYPPYKRTNLSKFLADGFSVDDFTLASADDLRKFYQIQLRQDNITEIDYREQKALGQTHSYCYDYLILATGARYELPAALQHPKLTYYHNKQETFALQEQFRDKQNIAILGAGVQGMETCYELLKLGKQVSIIDPHETPLSRFSCPYISDYLQKHLAQNEVECHWQQRIQQFDDSILELFDLVICCFGTRPVTDLFPPEARLLPNLQIAPNVFACGDNLVYNSQNNERCGLWHEAMDLGQLAGSNAALLAAGQAANSAASAATGQAHYQRKPYRTKIEIADRIIFLAPPIGNQPTSQQHFLQQGDYYQFFYNDAASLVGASLLCRDRDLLKPLQQAVWEQLAAPEVLQRLGIDAANEFPADTFQLAAL